MLVSQVSPFAQRSCPDLPTLPTVKNEDQHACPCPSHAVKQLLLGSLDADGVFERGPRTNTEGTKRRRDRRRWKERKRDRENIQEIAVPLTTTTGASTVLHAAKTFSGTDDGRGVLCGGGGWRGNKESKDSEVRKLVQGRTNRSLSLLGSVLSL